MRARTILTILLALMICVPVHGSSSAAQDEEVNDDPCLEDPEQPCNNQTTLYLWSNGISTHWSHFNVNETDNTVDNQWTNEKENGVIDVDVRFTMKPQLSKRLNMTLDGEVRVVLNIYLEGDWTNDNDGNTACGQNDCDELNVTLWAGATKIFRQHVPGVSEGWNTVMFTYRIAEGQELWDSSTANPSIQIEMKVRGNQQNTGPGGLLLEGTPANFSLRLSGDGESRVELPIDDSSWSDNFQAGDENVMPTTEQPGFLFVSAIAAMTIAAVYTPSRRDDSQDS